MQMEKSDINYMSAAKTNSDLCTLIVMEECGELIQAISKAKRNKLDKNNMAEEIADVLIGIEWIIEIYEIDEERIQFFRNFKENRVAKKLVLGKFE
ncbi:MAG: MazG nucleotide pyrophosphohydrolase domain-containing protein [Paraclostridium sp.]